MTNQITQKALKEILCIASSGHVLNRDINSTGFRATSAFIQNDVQQEIAELFLLNSSISNQDVEAVFTINRYLQFPFTEMTALSGRHSETGLKKISIEHPYPLDMKLNVAIQQRRSTRKYTGDAIAIEALFSILLAANGVTHTDKSGKYARPQRTCASGGGLYPVKIYIFVNKVINLTRGIYYFDPLKRALILLSDNAAQLDEFLIAENIAEFPNIQDSAFFVFFTIESWRCIAKYGSAGLRFAYIEIGEIAQNAHLAGTCLGISSCAYASFTDKRVRKLLCINGNYETFQHAILFGISAEE